MTQSVISKKNKIFHLSMNKQDSHDKLKEELSTSLNNHINEAKNSPKVSTDSINEKGLKHHVIDNPNELLKQFVKIVEDTTNNNEDNKFEDYFKYYNTKDGELSQEEKIDSKINKLKEENKKEPDDKRIKKNNQLIRKLEKEKNIIDIQAIIFIINDNICIQLKNKGNALIQDSFICLTTDKFIPIENAIIIKPIFDAVIELKPENNYLASFRYRYNYILFDACKIVKPLHSPESIRKHIKDNQQIEEIFTFNNNISLLPINMLKKLSNILQEPKEKLQGYKDFINMEHPTYYNKKLDKIIFPADNNEDCKKLIEILSKKYPTYEVPSIVNKHKK